MKGLIEIYVNAFIVKMKLKAYESFYNRELTQKEKIEIIIAIEQNIGGHNSSVKEKIQEIIENEIKLNSLDIFVKNLVSIF